LSAAVRDSFLLTVAQFRRFLKTYATYLVLDLQVVLCVVASISYLCVFKCQFIITTTTTTTTAAAAATAATTTKRVRMHVFQEAESPTAAFLHNY